VLHWTERPALMADLLPLFVNLAGRRVLLVGGGPVAAGKLEQLLAAGAALSVVAPSIHADIERAANTEAVELHRRAFVPGDIDGAWLVVAAATPAVNREVAEAAEARRVLVNAVDDPANATAFFGGVVRRSGVTFAISTSGDAPGLTALLRQALDALLPSKLGDWVREAERLRAVWRRDRIPIGDRRPLLLEAMNRLHDARDGDAADEGGDGRATGKEAVQHRARDVVQRPIVQARPVRVALVGAGPGDPAHLTRSAVAWLRAADLVLYDALVDDRVLRLARHAQRFFVGKRSGQHALSQSDIHAAMIRAARRGRRVVRLKGGDPFVFGRGGEEAEALLNAGIPFEVVPGVTSATAAPALAGIPVTHRGMASALVVVSGHDPGRFTEFIGGLRPKGTTLVVLMGARTRAALARALLARGWRGQTPAAVAVEMAQPGSDVWRGTLEDLAADRSQINDDGPATLIVGDVAALDLRAAARRSERKEQCL